MTQKQFFEMIGAPLANARWAWGAERGPDIVLRVWKDNIKTFDGKEYVRILGKQVKAPGPKEHGLRERIRHAERIVAGTRYFLVVCEAVDMAARPRRIRRFNAEEVFPGGSVRQDELGLWVELLPSISLDEFMEPQAAPHERSSMRTPRRDSVARLPRHAPAKKGLEPTKPR